MSFCNIDNCQNCCCDTRPALFEKINQEDKAILYNNRKEIVYYPGETIFKQHTNITHIACVKEGFIKVYSEGLNGRNILRKILKPGEIVGGMGLYVQEFHQLTCTALTTVECCLISLNSFKQLLETNHTFALELIKRINKFAIETTNRIVHLSHKNMYQRIAEMLIYLSDVIYKSDEIRLDLQRQDMADLCALNKEVLIRVLKEYKDQDLIELRGKELKILNKDKLISLSK